MDGLVVGQYCGGGRAGFMVSMSWFCSFFDGFRGGGREDGPGGVLAGGVALLCAMGWSVSSWVFTAWGWRLNEGFRGGGSEEEHAVILASEFEGQYGRGGRRGFSRDSMAWSCEVEEGYVGVLVDGVVRHCAGGGGIGSRAFISWL